MNAARRPSATPLPTCPWRDALRVSLGAAFCVAFVGGLFALAHASTHFSAALIGPIGASALLMMAFPESPYAKPYVVLTGNLVAAMVAMAWSHVPLPQVVIVALAVGNAVLATSAARAFHPPSAGLALMIALDGPRPIADDLQYLLLSVVAGSALLVIAAQFIAALARARRRLAGGWRPRVSGRHCRNRSDSIR